MDLNGPFKQSSRFLRRQLFQFWAITTILLSSGFALTDLVERHREVIDDAEHVRTLVTAALSTPMPTAIRQALFRSYTTTDREDHLDGMNVMMVLNNMGRIIYTSRPSWINLSITDSLVSQSETDDIDFQTVVNCFRNRQDSCIQQESNDFRLRASSFTVVRPIEVRRQDLGLGPERMLLLVNYDPGVVLMEFTQDLIAFFLIGAITATVLSLILWSMLSSRLLPKLMEASHTDGLTQLMNRSLFMEQAKELLAEAEDRSGELVFAILDLDHFKRINDTYGHSCGDEALIHVGEILRTVTRPDDLVCRFGGEEFALLLNASREAAGKALERLRLQLEMSRLNFAGHQLTLHTSIGAVATADCGYNIDFLYTTADKALYTAKQGGRNRVAWSNGRLMSRLSR